MRATGVENELDGLTAAGGLLSIGEKAAIPVLIELLGSDLPLPFSDPHLEVWKVARGMLLFHTDQDLGLEAAEDVVSTQAKQEAWRAWWESSGDDLVWDAGALRFSV